MNQKENLLPYRNVKILVNWDKKLIIHTQRPLTSIYCQDLIRLGYVEVGEYKPAKQDFYWLDKYFEMGHKIM